ncbi:MAG: OmpA family protein, partial [Bacteroidota bacterium]
RQYTITVHISCGDKVYLSKVDEFGLLFSQKSFNINLDDVLLRPPQVTFQQPEKYANKTEWQQLSTVYTADGTEHWMTFGSFAYAVQGQAHGEIYGAAHYAHYYIDDVSIVPVEPLLPTPALKPEVRNAAEGEFVAGNTYVFQNLQFASGQSVILPESFAELDRLQRHLRAHPDVKLIVTGHTDNVGDPASNLQLSHDRAEAVMHYLIQKEGVDRSRITTAGKGDQVPLTSNETTAGREKNRRVEFSLR